MRAPPPQEKPAAPDAYVQQGEYKKDPYASTEGGYQPDYSQQGYNQVISRLLEVCLELVHFVPDGIKKRKNGKKNTFKQNFIYYQLI